MAYNNFKPTIWSAFIQAELPKFTVFKNDCDFKFEGEAKEGKRVKVLGVGRPTLKDYTGADIDSPEQVEDTSVYINIDQAKYFNYSVDDVDKAQATEGLMAALATETTRAIAEVEDTFCAQEIALGAGKTITKTTAITTSALAKAAVDEAFVELWKQGVSSKDDITLYLTPEMYSLFENELIALKTDNDTLVKTGALGIYRSAKVKLSNNIYAAGGYDHVILKTSKGFAYCNGIDKLEAFRPEKRFMDAIKGLNTYGGKAVRPKEIVALKVKYS